MALLLLGLQLRGEIEQLDDLLRREVGEAEEAAAAHVGGDGAH